ncbi:MAG: hypothetical protein RML10_02405 [Geminocystis sp.]|nr:hypothetical protein [Geminocystis sp.]
MPIPKCKKKTNWGYSTYANSLLGGKGLIKEWQKSSHLELFKACQHLGDKRISI